MPHADLTYTDDLPIDPVPILARIEDVILAHDSGAGECKGRAWSVAQFHHSHVLVEISILPKPHRNAAFIGALVSELETSIKALIPVPCAFSLNVTFTGLGYVTNQHRP